MRSEDSSHLRQSSDQHLQTVCMFCAITSVLVNFRKTLPMAFEDDTSEILPQLEPVANFI